MDLQPLYDVKERLSYAAIAGTGLLDEDFRLKRAVEALSPLAAASPVFAKISAGVEVLLGAPAEERGGLLLDVLALVDAVAYTQGVTGVEGELVPLTPGSGTYWEASYGQLHPLLELLGGTGGGRMAQIKATWEEHPDYFADYRVLPALVRGLGDSYGELAELAASILERIGPAAVPLLKENFDPAGKREMVRRVRLLEKLAGGAENDFYLAQLPEAKKEVREALIYALRHHSGNTEKLLELVQTERGKAKEMVLWALARSDDPAAWDFWAVRAAKKPEQTAKYLVGSQQPGAGKLSALLLTEQLEPFAAAPDTPISKEQAALIESLLQALPGKTGTEVENCFRQAAALGTALDRPLEGVPGTWNVSSLVWHRGNRPFSRAVAEALHTALLVLPDRELTDLALELYESRGGSFLAPALTARLLTQEAEACWQWAEQRFYQRGIFGRSARKDALEPFRAALEPMCWKEEGCVLRLAVQDPADDTLCVYEQPLRQVPGPRWYGLLMDGNGALDQVLLTLLRTLPEGAEVPERVGYYLYQRSLDSGGQGQVCFELLLRLGWQNWDGYLRKRAEKTGELSFYRCKSMLDRLPLTNGEKAVQLRELDRLTTGVKRLKSAYGGWPTEQVKQLIAAWEADPSGRSQ